MQRTCPYDGMQDDQNLSRAYALKTPDDSVDLYRDWAASYDETFAEEYGYLLHHHVARAFVAAGGQGPVLDIGAGTGLCGTALAALNVNPIDGTDISPDMLEQARAKDVYRALDESDILAGMPYETDQFPGVVSSGTFTLGHVGPEALGEVIRVLTPGGWGVLSVNMVHFTADGFEAAFKALETQLTVMRFEDVPIYAPDAPDAHDDRATDMARLAIFQKA